MHFSPSSKTELLSCYLQTLRHKRYFCLFLPSSTSTPFSVSLSSSYALSHSHRLMPRECHCHYYSYARQDNLLHMQINRPTCPQRFNRRYRTPCQPRRMPCYAMPSLLSFYLSLFCACTHRSIMGCGDVTRLTSFIVPHASSSTKPHHPITSLSLSSWDLVFKTKSTH